MLHRSMSTIVSFRMLNKCDLVTMLQKCVEILVSSPGKEFDKTVEKLKEFLTQFQKLEGGCALSYVPLQIKLKLIYNGTNGYHFLWYILGISCTKLSNISGLFLNTQAQICHFCFIGLWFLLF